MERRPEILAPVGSEEALTAAVFSGADAVYLGTGECNARRNAGKFSGDDLLRAVRFCHARGVKVYITVNTLVRDEELQTTANALHEIAQSGADAIIVQDLAVAALAQKICPELPMHASTQMAVHNAEGVRVLTSLGFCRVVLARELSLEELRAIRNETQAELEVFVHGALCMSASGMCYLSAMLGERSGNRGLCAQPCRLQFSCNGNDYALSLKDMSHLAHLQKLAELGIASLKIEGRMKRPEYVAASVNAVHCALEGRDYDADALKAVFSRNGFTDGYFTGKRTRAMFGIRTKEEALEGKETWKGFRELYRTERSVLPVSAVATARLGMPATLTVTDGKHTVTVTGGNPLTAETSGIGERLADKSLRKTGGTPFVLQELTWQGDAYAMLPAAAWNALRREALAQLLELRGAAEERRVNFVTVTPGKRTAAQGRNAFRLRFQTAEQWFDVPEAEQTILPVRELISHPECITEKTVAELPALCYPGDMPALRADLLQLRALGVRAGLTDNIGGVLLLRETDMEIHGGAGLNVTNRLAAQQYADLGLRSITASFELPMPKIRDLDSPIPKGCIIAGRLPLMQLRSCPARGFHGCGNCSGHPVVTDRMGRTFPLVCHDRRYTTMLNSVPLYVAEKPLPPLDFYTVAFTTESPEQCKELWNRIRMHLPPGGEHTTGIYYRTLQ